MNKKSFEADIDVISNKKPKYEEELKNRIQTRSIDNRIDEILLFNDGKVLAHIEEMDEGVLHLVLINGDHEAHFSLTSTSDIKIIEQ